jgi:hypothetical protein
MSAIGALLSDHPWWIAAAVAGPVLVALWVVVGGIVLETRHGEEISGRRPW